MHFISDFSYIVDHPLARAGLGPAFPSEIPARRMASILCMRLSLGRRMGQPRFSRLRVVCISHFTSDFLPPCMQKQKTLYRKCPRRNISGVRRKTPAVAESRRAPDLVNGSGGCGLFG